MPKKETKTNDFKKNPTPPVTDPEIARSLRSPGRIFKNTGIQDKSLASSHQSEAAGMLAFKKKALFWALAAAIALIIILTSIRITAFDKDLYKKEFTKVGTYSRLENADYLLNDIQSFFSYKEELDTKYFTERESSHMNDVRQFLEALNVLFYVLIALSIIAIIIIYYYFTKDMAEYAKILRNSAIITLALTFIIVILSLNFEPAFMAFHFLFFKAGTYSFPTASTLIMLFPQEFFYDLLAAIMLRTCITALIVLAFSLLFTCIAKKYNL
jgi:integral membrane protein (TIGR01906 family)